MAGKDGPLYLAELDSDGVWQVGSFDPKAAIELAALSNHKKQTQ